MENITVRTNLANELISSNKVNEDSYLTNALNTGKQQSFTAIAGNDAQTDPATLGQVTDYIDLDFSWFETKCRAAVFSQLSKMTDAGLRVIDGRGETFFGDTDAKLQATMIIKSGSVYPRMVKGGSIGAAEAYIDGLWSSHDLTRLIQVFARFQSILDKLENNQSPITKLKHWLLHRTNRNSQVQAKKNIMAHYDLGNDLYKQFLDKEMVYSSAIYSHEAQSLEQAQLNKFDLICKRLDLQPGDKLLEVGTGWGGLAIYAAQHYDVHVTTTTISEQQYEYAAERINTLGLDSKVTLLKDDYRLLTGKFDKIVSIEMIEAVGKQYFSTFFSKLNSLLKPRGKMLIQAITIADQRFEYYANNVDFIQKYIFPGGCLPSVTVMNQHLAKDTDMIPVGLHDIGLDYAKTLADWQTRFQKQWPEIEKQGYDNTFKRLWEYYLSYCEGAFIERRVSTVHLVAEKSI